PRSPCPSGHLRGERPPYGLGSPRARIRGLDPSGRRIAHLFSRQLTCWHAFSLRHTERDQGRRAAVQRRATTKECIDELRFSALAGGGIDVQAARNPSFTTG